MNKFAFTDPWGNEVWIDLRAVIAISKPKTQKADEGKTNTYLWTSAPSENCYFGVQEGMEECLRRWALANCYSD